MTQISSGTQIGRILALADPARKLYDLCLVDSGALVRALLVMPAKGSSAEFAPGDHVKVAYGSGMWMFDGYIPGFIEDATTAPRADANSPGDQFFGNAENSAGVHVTGGTVAVEAGTIDGDGKLRRAAGSYWVPDFDAIRNVCRRFEIDAATGEMQFLHDDTTGETAFRIWARTFANPGTDGRVARIHMGYHKDPVGANISITTFPPGPDPTAGMKDFNFTLDPTQQMIPFAGQWPKLERNDWQTRYYVMADGTAFYENALVPAPSLTPTTAAQVNTRVIITPEGFITTDAKQLVTLKAMNNLITLKQSYIMTATTALFTIKQFFAVNAETITLFTKGGAPASVLIGKLEDTLPLCNLNLFTWILDELIQFLVTHSHAGVQTGSGVSGPAIQPVAIPGENSVTKATQAS